MAIEMCESVNLSLFLSKTFAKISHALLSPYIHINEPAACNTLKFELLKKLFTVFHACILNAAVRPSEMNFSESHTKYAS